MLGIWRVTERLVWDTVWLLQLHKLPSVFLYTLNSEQVAGLVGEVVLGPGPTYPRRARSAAVSVAQRGTPRISQKPTDCQ